MEKSAICDVQKRNDVNVKLPLKKLFAPWMEGANPLAPRRHGNAAFQNFVPPILFCELLGEKRVTAQKAQRVLELTEKAGRVIIR